MIQLTHIAILAGGKSQRMGVNKAKLEFERTGLLKRIVDDAQKLGLKVLLCSDDLQYSEVAEQVVASPDLLPHKSGALSAIQPALQQCYYEGGRWLWVYACDSLVLPSELLSYFQDAIEELDHDALQSTMMILPKLTKILPLMGLYRSELHAAMKNYLLAGERRVMVFTDGFPRYYVSLPEKLEECCNFNTLTQYQCAKIKYSQQRN